MKIENEIDYNVSSEWDEIHRQRTGRDPVNRLLNTYEIESAKYIKDNSSIIELACGDGRFLRYILDNFKGCSVYGIDLSQFIIDYARLHHKINCDVMDYRDLPDDKQYDVVMHHQFIEHMKDPTPLMDKSLKLLKKGGMLLMSSVTENFNWDRFHLVSFTQEDFEALLKPHFESISVYIYDLPIRKQSTIFGVGFNKK